MYIHTHIYILYTHICVYIIIYIYIYVCICHLIISQILDCKEREWKKMFALVSVSFLVCVTLVFCKMWSGGRRGRFDATQPLR